MARNATMVIHFMDGSKIVFTYPKQAGTDSATIAATVRKAIDQDKLAVEVDGDLMVIPMRNVKYVHVTPAPDALPKGVLVGARLTG